MGAPFRRHGVDPGYPSTVLAIDTPVVRTDSDVVIAIYDEFGYA